MFPEVSPDAWQNIYSVQTVRAVCITIRRSTMDAILPSQGDNIIRTKNLDDNYDKHGLANMLLTTMKKHKSKTAQIDSQSGRSNTYEEFLRKSIKLAIGIRSRGIEPDDIICFCSENHSDVYIAYFASLLIGAVTSALDPTMSKADMTHLLSQVPPKLIFTSPKSEKLIQEVLTSVNLTPAIVIFGKTDKNTPFDDLLFGHDVREEEEEFTPYKTDDIFKTAVIFFSSGTTGLPKGICLNHYSLMCNAITTGPLLDGAQVMLSFTTVYWISSVLLFLTSIIEGVTRLLVPRFDAETVWYHIEKYNVNLICCATNQGARIFKTPIPNGINLTNLKTMLVGGSKVPEELVRSLREKLPYVNVRQAYGMTEVGGLCTVQEPGDTNYDLATCGRVRQGFWYKVVDPETEEILGPNQQGELRLKTKLQMNGYYNLASSDAWDSNGWLKTGDIVHYDEDHYFFFVDRLKAVIKYRGIHVPSTLLEEILLGHPAVEEAAVIGLPHPEDEEHPMAAVVLKDGTGNGQEEEDLRRYVDDKVDDPKRLRGGVRIVQELPTTPTGKYNKREIKRRICEEMKIAL